jgi:hypothetical protein
MTYTPNVPEMLVTDQLDVPNIRDVFLAEFSDTTPFFSHTSPLGVTTFSLNPRGKTNPAPTG